MLSCIGKPNEKLQSVLSKVGYHIAFKTNNNLGKHVKINKLTKFIKIINLVYID